MQKKRHSSQYADRYRFLVRKSGAVVLVKDAVGLSINIEEEGDNLVTSQDITESKFNDLMNEAKTHDLVYSAKTRGINAQLKKKNKK